MDECITTVVGSETITKTCRKSGRSFAILAPLTHERQRLQLCALHTLNNLLQPISPENEDEKRPGKFCTKPFMACGGKYYQVAKPQFATKSELDSIADALAIQEKGLYETGVPSAGAQREPEKIEQSGINLGASISWWKVIKSHHRNPISGNYSFEVSKEVTGWFGPKRSISL